ncbi:hypothetical protein BB558_002588 [Smittium angustum]|uniref:Uncharacterized protein n=1 Tax=Smittium angustum TaxID=133377 RepID=A0A2U1J8N0_SMIAN|nr:hypothetical protein BB558_002588 [Smittium angustum]
MYSSSVPMEIPQRMRDKGREARKQAEEESGDDWSLGSDAEDYVDEKNRQFVSKTFVPPHLLSQIRQTKNPLDVYGSKPPNYSPRRNNFI